MSRLAHTSSSVVEDDFVSNKIIWLVEGRNEWLSVDPDGSQPDLIIVSAGAAGAAGAAAGGAAGALSQYFQTEVRDKNFNLHYWINPECICI